ncbi:MAG: PfkB family carbohydrate kinase [Bacteroidetes bacterium]|nr:PfkB family carbohydrate kinase [Bacteroidota bacterium]MDA0942820.1 PfkB family carbohydrate kinase [Bacteroidota bacterium]MDA1111836.1 PfkB family carbohydrate kinase [Bacteroidota bacterium]
MSLLIIGSVAFDAIETPFGQTGKIVGGAASFISLASSLLNAKNGLVAVVGEDFEMDFIAELNGRGVDTQGLQVKQGEKSFFWSGKYHMDMNSRDTLVTELNVLGTFDPIIPDDWKEPDYVMLGNLSPQVQLTTLNRLTKKPKLVVMDTMNFWMDIAMPELKEVIAKVDVLTINDEEARQLSGEYSLRKAARLIHSMGPHTVIIKKGEHGALLFQNDEVFFCPALPLEEVFDPTGAGDTFAGGFVGYLASTGRTDFDAMKTAIVYGSCLASFCVEKFGTEALAQVTPVAMKARLDQFKRLIAVEA